MDVNLNRPIQIHYSMRYLSIISLLILSVLTTNNAQALEKVSLQLDWKYQFEFAGFIMAKEKGFYKAAGLDVDLLEYQAGTDTVERVLTQQNNYGIHNSSVIIHDGKLQPVILLATYYQQSPLIFVTSKDIKTPKDMIGKTVMGTKDELKYSSLALLLDHFYITRNNTHFVEHSFNIDDFIQHKVDVMSAFRTNQLFELDQLNIDYNIIDPADFGFFMSAVNLFTSQAEALQHPERTRKFINASNQGWAYALENPVEAISIIYEKYSQKKSMPALSHEVTVTRKMMLLDFFSIGALNTDLSIRTIKQLHHSGLLPANQKLGTFLFEDLLSKNSLNVILDDEQQLYLHNKKAIKMCVQPNGMPFESIQNGKHIGIAADLLHSFTAQLPIPIQLIETSSWHESLQKIQSGQCDILSLASRTRERENYLHFTDPYLTFPVVMATTYDKFFIRDIADIRSQKLGVVKGYSISERLRDKIKGINIVDVDSVSDGLRRVESGELYGYIDNIATIADSVQKEFPGALKISSRLDDNVDLSIATRKDEPILHEIFQKLVTNIKPEDSQQAYNKWVSVKQEVSFDYSTMWKILFVIAVLAAGFVFHNYQLRNLNQRLKTLSITDKLTGLYNRVKIDEVLIKEKAQVDRYNTETAVILLDIDFFKRVNDTFGHGVGDIVLADFAKILQKNVRLTDYVGRWGGEEFIIICPNINTVDAHLLAQKLINKIREHSFPQIGKITASAGVSAFAASLSIKETLSHVDDALYSAKQTGRDKVSVSDNNNAIDN